ncbi:hypothetical protein [Chitinophaga silvisoli]|nr:hypothetical protein [Chitinophaga silvisoli]
MIKIITSSSYGSDATKKNRGCAKADPADLHMMRHIMANTGMYAQHE